MDLKERVLQIVPDYPEIHSRLIESGLLLAGPWIWIRTLEPVRQDAPSVSRIAAFVPSHSGGTLWRSDEASASDDGDFGPEWDGHQYEALGLLRYFNRDGLQFTSPPHNLPGQPPTWQSQALGRDLDISADLWWQRAYRPTDDGGLPSLIAEMRWWPGLIGAQPFFHPMTEVDETISQKALRAAERARKLLYGLQPKLDQGGRPNDTGYYGPEDGPRFATDVEMAIRALIHDGKRISKSSVSKQMPMDRETLRGYLMRFSVNLKSVETKIMADED